MSTKSKKYKKGDFGRLIKYLKPHIVPVVFIILSSILSVALMISAALVLRELTNTINDAAALAFSGTAAMSELLDYSQVVTLCLMLAGMYGASVLFSFLHSFIMSKVIQLVTNRLRTEITDKINRLPLSYFDTHAYGDTLSRVTNDVDTVGQALNSTVTSLVAAIFQLIGVTIAMLVTSWQMALTEFATIPISLLFVLVFVKISQRFFVKQQKLLGSVNGNVEEAFSGQMIIKAFNAEKTIGKRFRQNNDGLQKATYKANIINGGMHPLMTFVSKLGYIAVCVVGGILYGNGMTDMGSLAAFIVFINLFQSPINQIGNLTGTLQGGMAAAGRIFEMLNEQEEPDESTKAVYLSTDTVKGNISFQNVQFGYSPDKIIINDFSCEVNSGQKIAIVGPTGAGKTTLVNLLMRFYKYGGDITIDGTSANDLTRKNVREIFSMVLQDTWLFSGTIRENLVYTNPNITDEQLDEATKAANIYNFIMSLPNGYDTVLSDEINISGGQKQLLTIARAMLEDSPILILDEATSNVDTRTELQIQSAMDALTKSRTSFVIAHRLSTIKNADVILVLKDGDIIEQGNHTDLLAQDGFYASLYQSQFASAS